MLDIKFIRENKEEVQKSCKLRNIDCNIEKLLEIDEKRLKLMKEVEEMNAEKNTISSEMKKADNERRQEIIKQSKKIKENLSKKEPELKKIKEEFEKIMDKLPNRLSPEVPIGKDESENVVIRKVGEPTKFDFQSKDHLEIGEELGIIDTKTAAKVSGARFNYIKGGAALLQFALIQFVFDVLTSKEKVSELAEKVGNPNNKPFIPVIPPVIVRSEIMKKMDRFNPIEDRYYLKEDDSLLVGSAEHSLGPIHMNEILEEKDLPIRYVGYSTAFRREAGTYGKDTRGILRCHQFDKLEMESFSLPENGQKEQDLFVAIQEYIVASLKIPYQVVSICTGDIGKPDFRQIDIECWMPGQDKYRETHTSDYMTDFQSRRLGTRVKRKNGEMELVHMNDATAGAIGRLLIAILENFQQADGSVIIPEVLRKYMPGNIDKIVK
jgi:seryl-tRNA synthetase